MAYGTATLLTFLEKTTIPIVVLCCRFNANIFTSSIHDEKLDSFDVVDAAHGEHLKQQQQDSSPALMSRCCCVNV